MSSTKVFIFTTFPESWEKDLTKHIQQLETEQNATIKSLSQVMDFFTWKITATILYE